MVFGCQHGRQPHFPLEAPQRVRIAGPFGSYKLHGAPPAQQHVLGEVHLAHAAGAESRFQLILPQRPRFGGLPAQYFDAVRREDDNGRGHADPEREAAQDIERELRVQRSHPKAQNRKENERAGRENTDDGCAAAPRVRDERTVSDEQGKPAQ